VIRTDENVICVGLAQDALNRLANLSPDTNDHLQQDVLSTLKEAPVHGWESLVRGGLNRDTLSKLKIR